MDAAAKMELFQNLFYVSAALAVIGLSLAIFFYFYFDIRYIYLIISGKDRREAVEQMTKRSARNGRLRRMNKHSTKPADAQQAAVHAPAPAEPDLLQTVPLNQIQHGQTGKIARTTAEETSLLVDHAVTAPMHQKTEAKHEVAAGETEFLSEPVSSTVQTPGNFVLTENTILIHTNEII